MKIFPAIDLIDNKAVRLVKGDYNQKTVFNDNPLEVAVGFKNQGAEYLHLVDLDGAKSGLADNFETIKEIIDKSGLKVEIGGGIRNIETVERYLEIGAFRVIIGTAAITDEAFLDEALQKYGEKIAVGVDIKDGFVATHGWTEVSKFTCEDFIKKMQEKGVETIICTDISKDGMMSGTNLSLYKNLSEKFTVNITASGGVSSLEDVKTLNDMNMYGAILGKALYLNSIDLNEAIEISKE
ncbi:MAG: 1-(5-phosphoribosyl)-5-[Clostridia bacterium]|nr:1-(5-phosphoribosyl)-5-[(5-phosphoribosylamino)methylideneamino]imidazole-4-carboxamide isomerase [Clostridia bacterium]